MKKNLFILVFVLSVAVNLGFLGMIVWHHFQRYDEIGHKHGFCPFYEKRFGLSKEKAKKMEELRRSLMQKMKPIGQELAKERRELMDILFESEPNKEKIDQKLKNIQALQGEMQLMLVEHMLSAKENLTQEEQKRFFDFILKRMDSYRPFPGIRRPILKRKGGEKG